MGYLPSSHTAYIRVAGAANKLGKATSAIYKIDTNSDKVSGSVNFPLAAGTVFALSPDGNKLAYITTSSINKAAINVLDIKKNKTQTVQWDKGPLPTSSGSMAWSPDSKKLLVQTINLAPPTANQTPEPSVIAYIDVSKKDGPVNVIQEISDPAHQAVLSLGWLDNSTVVYQLKKSSKAYSFVEASSQTLRQDIGSKSSSPEQVPSGDLLQVINY